MSNPTTKGARALLNLPGHHSTAAIVAEVTEYGPNRYDSHAFIQISDCDRKISLDFDVTDVYQFENNLHKIDTLLDCIKKFRRAVAAAQKKNAGLSGD